MEILIAVISLLFLNYSLCVAQDVSCKKLEPVTKFQQEMITGIWYGAIRNPNQYDENNKCFKYNLTLDTPNALHAISSQIRINDNQPIKFNVVLDYVDNVTVANFKGRVIEINPEHKFDIVIAAVDYDNYQIYQGCDYEKQIEYCWVVTKERKVSNNLWNTILSVAKKIGLNRKLLKRVDQANCYN